MTISIIIPARYGSSRYRGKPLVKILVKSLMGTTVGSTPGVGLNTVFLCLYGKSVITLTDSS